MKIKIIFVVILIVCGLHCQTFSQNKSDTSMLPDYDDQSVKNEIGFDMFYFVNLFRNYEGQGASLFTIAYNRELSERISLRSTIGLGYTNTKYIYQDTIAPLKTIVKAIDIKSGISWSVPTYRRWQFYYGADIEFQYGYTKQEMYSQGINENVDKVFSLGPGPFLGLLLYLNPRVSLSIESNMNFLYSKNTSAINYSNSPDKNTTSVTKGFTTVFTKPQNVYLSIKF